MASNITANYGAAAQASGEAAGRSGEASSAARSVAAARESQGELGEARGASDGGCAYLRVEFEFRVNSRSRLHVHFRRRGSGGRHTVGNTVGNIRRSNNKSSSRAARARRSSRSWVGGDKLTHACAEKKRPGLPHPRRDPEISRDLPIPIMGAAPMAPNRGLGMCPGAW